jgi:hypothetical protein
VHHRRGSHARLTDEPRAAVKRSRSIKLVLAGGLSAGALSGCSPSGNAPPKVSTANAYTNNHFIPGAGYYHAPYRAWYPMPYNEYSAASKLYYHGGRWDTLPHASIVNISQPTPQAVAQAEAARTDVERYVSRGGWGGTSSHRTSWS